MKKVLLALGIGLLLTVSAYAEVLAQIGGQSADNDKEAESKLETFISSKKGEVLIKDFVPMGHVSGKHGVVSIDTLIISDPSPSGHRIKGLRIEVTDRSGRVERSSISFLDLDEIASLSKALGFMTDLGTRWKDVEKPYTEVIFSTRGGFQAGFYKKQRDIGVFVASGRINAVNCYFSDMSYLLSLKGKIDDGYKMLNAAN